MAKNHALAEPILSGHLASRYRALYRSFKRMLPRRLSTYEKTLLDRCVIITLRAEHARRDTHVSLNELVRLDNLAARARRDWLRLAETSPDKAVIAPSLHDYFEQRGHGQQAHV
jgi:hypothetical protein